jgi:hypothetical protein
MFLRPVIALCAIGLASACLPAAKDSDLAPGGMAGGGGAPAAGGAGGGHRPHSPDGGSGGAGGAANNGGSGGSPDAAATSDGEPQPDPDAPRAPMATPITDPTALAIAGELQGAFLQLDCAGPEIEFQFCVPKDRGILNVPLKFGGQPGKMYAVTLRVWGVVEGVNYAGGRKAGEHFYIGGTGTTPRTAEYGLTVGNQSYHLNHFVIGAGDHYTYGVSYETEPIMIPGGAAMVLYVRDPDNFINTNHMQSEADNPSPGLETKLAVIKSQPLQAQFVYIEIGSAKSVD